MANLIFPTWFDEKTTIAQDDYILMADSEDNNRIKKAKYSNLKWEKWDTWPKWEDGADWQDGADWTSATITIWSTTTWAAGSDASVTNTWTSSAAVLNFTIPQWVAWTDGKDWVDGKDWKDWTDWQDGAAATITVWTTTTWSPWTNASVTNKWTSSAAVFDFTIPQWAPGATWNWVASITSSKSWKITTVTITETNWDVETFTVSDWADWQWSWDVVWPNSATDGHLAVFDWVTWKLIKDWWAIPTVPTNVSDFINDAWYITWIDSGDVTTALWYTPADSASLGTAASKNTWTSSGNVPVLDSNWKLNTSVVPAVAITDTFTINSSSELTSLSTAEKWDVAICPSELKTYILYADPYSVASNWKLLPTPTWDVSSVNGKTWVVTLDADDISDSTTTNKFVTASDKTTWSGKQDALTLPSTPTSWHLVTWWADNKTLADGWAVPTWVPAVWTNWQVLTVVSWVAAWANAAWSDYSRVTKTISWWTVELWLRTIINTPTWNFTLTAPATLKDWEEYAIRIISGTSYTMTLWTWFTNPRNVDTTLSGNATDQYVFLAINGELELQPLVDTWA